MRVIDLAIKDLTQVFRDKRAAAFLFIMPVVFTAFMGFAMRPQAAQDPRFPVGFLNNDSASGLAADLQSLLESSNAIRLVAVEPKDAGQLSEKIRAGDLAAAIIVPAGYGEAVLRGEAVNTTVIVAENSVTGQTALRAIRTAAMRLQSAAQIARMSVEAVEAVKPFESESARGAAIDKAALRASEAWLEPPFALAAESAVVPEPKSRPVPSSFNQSSPGMLVQFTVFGLTTSAMVLMLERKSRTLQRMITTSMSRAEIIAGHLLAMFALTFSQEIILILVGQIGFGVNYGREPLAVSLVMVALALWVAALGLFIGVLAKAEEQVSLWALICMFVFSALGGAWFPLEYTGATFSVIGHLMPSAWAMDGFQNIIVRGLSIQSVWQPVGILMLYATAFFGLAVWRFRYE